MKMSNFIIGVMFFIVPLFIGAYENVIHESCGDKIHWVEGDRDVDLVSGNVEIKGKIDYTATIQAMKITILPGSIISGNKVVLKSK